MTMSRLIAVFAVASFIFTAASVPFSAIVGLFELDRVGISYARAEGTLWRGHLSDVYWRDAPVGQVMIRPVLSALLSGKFSLAFVVDGRVVMSVRVVCCTCAECRVCVCQGPEVAGWKREWQNRVCVLVGGSGERVRGGRRGQVGCRGLVRGRVLGVVRVHRRGVWAWHVKGAGFV